MSGTIEHSQRDQAPPQATRGRLGVFTPPPGHVAVIIPSYRVREHILEVIAGIGPTVDAIHVVDDACPEGSGILVEHECTDPRVRVHFHGENQGVGAATLTGFAMALREGAGVVIKIDGDGQMDPSLIPLFVQPIVSGEADFAKGNRFYDLAGLAAMPRARLLGNAILSLLTKLSAGYWQTFDPTNGFIAMHGEVARRLPFQRIAQRYFFETDLLFHLNLLHAKVIDVPMQAIYGDEVSGLRINRILLPFMGGHLRNFSRRVFYNYFLRDFSVASLEFLAGIGLLLFGTIYGLAQWGADPGGARAGTVMLAGLPIILGVQFLLAFLAYDIQSVPKVPIHARLSRLPPPRGSDDATQK